MIGVFFACVYIATGTYGPIGEIYKASCHDIPAPHYTAFRESRRQTINLRHQHHHYDSFGWQLDTPTAVRNRIHHHWKRGSK